jgi:transmembrane sensor
VDNRPPSPASLTRASEWLLDLESHPERFEAFDQWLHADPEHFAAWAQVNRAWDALAPAVPGSALSGPAAPRAAASSPVAFSAAPSRPMRPARPRRARLALLAAACLCAVAVGGSWFAEPAWRADYRTGVGKSRVVQLADGSRVTLAAQTAVNINYQGRERQIELVRGEALFDVVHDAQRPFQVNVGAASVRVLGTVFDVAHSAAGLKVEVREGAVGVRAGGLPYRLAAGQRLWLDASDGHAQQSVIAADDVASWVEGQQFFENARVIDVVEQLRRYQHGWIVIGSDRLGQQRVTGLYDLRDPQRALQALMAPLGGQVAHYSPLLTVLQEK